MATLDIFYFEFIIEFLNIVGICERPVTTKVRRLCSVKYCPCKNMVIVGPYLTCHDHLVEKSALKHAYKYASFVWPLRWKSWKDNLFWLELYILYTIFLHGQFFTLNNRRTFLVAGRWGRGGILTCERDVYPHAYAEAYCITESYNSSNKFKTYIAYRKRFKIVSGTINCFIVYFFWYIIIKKKSINDQKKNSLHLLFKQSREVRLKAKAIELHTRIHSEFFNRPFKRENMHRNSLWYF